MFANLRRRLRYLYLAYLSKPASFRPIYRLIRKHKLRRIVELGVGTGQRSVRMIEVAAATVGAESVLYSGIDLFELRGTADGPGMSLKMAHRLLLATGARIRLLPGDPMSALARSANGLLETDLLVISADQDERSLEKAWFYVPRILHADAHILVEQPLESGSGFALVPVSLDEVRRRAEPPARRRAA